MGTIGLVILLVVTSMIVSWLLAVGMCAVTASDWLCGHNAFIPLMLFFVASLVLMPLFWRWLREPAHSAPSTGVCSKCGAPVSFVEDKCPTCGFKFGAAA